MAHSDAFRKGDNAKLTTHITDWAQWMSGQTTESGALSILYCATSPDLDGKQQLTSSM